MSSEKSRYTRALNVFSEDDIGDENGFREKRTRGLCNYKIFALGTLNMKGAKTKRKKNVKKDKLLRTSLISLKRHTPSHNTLFTHNKNVFCYSNCYSIRSLERDCFQERRHPQVWRSSSSCVFCVCWIDHPRVHFVLFYLLFSAHVIFSNKRECFRARAREGERLLHSSQLQTPFAVKASFVPSFRRKERVNKV